MNLLHKQSRIQGFSLVELSIVIILLALLVGGIIATRSMIANSRLTGVITDIKKYSKAMDDFQEVYQALPGDISDPNSSPSSSTKLAFPDPADAAIYPAGGNGNGNIDTTSFANPRITGTPNTTEALQFWLHLKLAKLIAGNFDGLSPYTLAVDAVKGGVPGSKIDGVGYNVRTDATLGTLFELAGFSASLSKSNLAALSPVDASVIDGKIDDGIPNTGIVQSTGIIDGVTTEANGNCIDTTLTPNNYKLSYDSPACIVQFITTRKATLAAPIAATTVNCDSIGKTQLSATPCPTGYTGDIWETCDATGTWKTMRQTCEIVKCDGRPVGETRRTLCAEGYTGTITETCEISGTWSKDYSNCVEP
jgi:prepilin-type N-terminal cleavage/methylation domain-containing protein